MKYILAHPYERTFLGKREASWDWLPYEEKFVFKNGIETKEALSSIPPILDSYGFIKQPFWMKVSGLKGF